MNGLLWMLFALIHITHAAEYTNSFVVEVDGSDDVAQLVAAAHALRIVHKSTSLEGVYHLVHDSVASRSKRSADEELDKLARDPLVKYAEQQEILHRDKRKSLPLNERGILYDKQVELELPKIDQTKILEKYFGSSKKRGKNDCSNFDKKDLVMRFNDPYYCLQWYYTNVGQTNGIPGNDLNVKQAWERGYNGKGVVVTVLDDGLDQSHPDLKDNYDQKASEDLNAENSADHDPSPEGGSRNAHGTRCAGEIAAKADNGVCGVGIAYGASIGGIRLLDGQVTDAKESRALNFQTSYIDIYSASWGPTDDGETVDGPRHFGQRALKKGVEKGRNGRGSIYVWATGNGGEADDCNCDGYVGSPYTIAVGTINEFGLGAYFSEWCTSTMAVTYNGGSHVDPMDPNYKMLDISVITTDIDDGCDLNFQGTSSAAPLAAGCIALALQANPNLTWRDVQYIIVKTAKIPNSEEPGWTINGAGYHINPRFGFGAFDCTGMVDLALNWTHVDEQHVCEISANNEEVNLESRGSVVQSLYSDGCEGTDQSIGQLEHVQVAVKIDFSYRGDLRLVLTSPSGTQSEVLSVRDKDSSKEGFDNWKFMTVHNWGENPVGEWKLTASDEGSKKNRTNNKGVVKEWSLTLYGVASASPSEKDTSQGRSENIAHKPKQSEVKKIIKTEKHEKSMEKKETADTEKEDWLDGPYWQKRDEDDRLHSPYWQKKEQQEDETLELIHELLREIKMETSLEKK